MVDRAHLYLFHPLRDKVLLWLTVGLLPSGKLAWKVAPGLEQ